METPTNPLLGISDITQIVKIAKEFKLLTIVDNTFMTPYLQKPLGLGADIVLHSGTKYLGGHSDLIAGLVVTKTKELADKIYFIQKSTGAILSPNDSWLLIRGIKTLAVRMDRHLENAKHVVSYLENHNAVQNVFYPGLTNHHGHEIQKKQADGFGGMIAFILSQDYNLEKFVVALSIITFGESLGGVESLMTHPATMTHGSIHFELREKMGIVQNLLRISVGIENYQDIIKDLDVAFQVSKK